MNFVKTILSRQPVIINALAGLLASLLATRLGLDAEAEQGLVVAIAGITLALIHQSVVSPATAAKIAVNTGNETAIAANPDVKPEVVGAVVDKVVGTIGGLAGSLAGGATDVARGNVGGHK